MKTFAHILLLAGLIAVVGCATTAVDTPEVLIEDLVAGNGREAQDGDTLQFHYEARLLDGTVFDSSWERGEPALLILGVGLILDDQEPAPVIDGLTQGIPGMRPGGLRRLTIPPELAYGANSPPGSGIPPNSTLQFTVELIDIK